MIRQAVVLAVVVGSVAEVSAQWHADAEPSLAFEIASVKPGNREAARQGGRSSPDRFHAPYSTLRTVISYAYGMDEFRIRGGPKWVGSDRWDISALADRARSRVELRAMVRQLLAERFGLKTHAEKRELPIYDLVLANADLRLGPNMKPAITNCEPFRNAQRFLAAPDVSDDVRRRCGTTGRTWGGGVLTLHHAGWPTTRLVESLQPIVGRVIVDKTGLTGAFDIELTYQDDNTVRQFSGFGKRREAPPLPIALQEQLGLKLEPSRGPVEVLVIDSVDRPTPD